jgi:hypothetical protein
MKGVDMGIKLAQQNRTAEYGIALGLLIHAAWRGLARPLASGNPGGEYSTASRCKTQQRSPLREI